MRQRPIPITAITGFLGAGKTTLLDYWLSHNHGLKLGVVVNDFGDINLDAQFVADQTDDTMELTNGCICCNLDTLELNEALDQFTHPGSDIDHIIIEASGLAEPVDLASTLKTSGGAKTQLDAIVAVLDPINAFLSEDSQAITIQQIENSQYLVINKADISTPEQLKQLDSLISKHSPRARIITTKNGAVDLRMVLDTDTTIDDSNQNLMHDQHRHLHEQYTAVSFSSLKAFDPIAFQNFINNQLPTAVYRAKGQISFGAKGQDRCYRLQIVGNRTELSWSEWIDKEPKTELVMIGRDLNEFMLKKALSDCIDPQPGVTANIKPIQLPKSRS